MKRIALCLLIVIIVLPAVAYVTDEATIQAISSKLVRKIYVPFRSPPPTMYYIPNEMVVQLTC
jgi:hypothetical protein